MTQIICPTRGGQHSYPNQDRAISIAKERGADLLFLYVSDVRFLEQFASPILVDVEEELDEMGEFLLAMAEQRAEGAGVNVTTAVRHGIFREALLEVVREHEGDIVVLGSPEEDTAITTQEYLADLIQYLLTEAGVEVIVLRDGEIVE